MHVDRDVVSDRAVGLDLAVVSAPTVQLFAGAGKRHRPVRVQTFGPEVSVESLDEPVVGGLDPDAKLNAGRLGATFWRSRMAACTSTALTNSHIIQSAFSIPKRLLCASSAGLPRPSMMG